MTVYFHSLLHLYPLRHKGLKSIFLVTGVVQPFCTFSMDLKLFKVCNWNSLKKKKSLLIVQHVDLPS